MQSTLREDASREKKDVSRVTVHGGTARRKTSSAKTESCGPPLRPPVPPHGEPAEPDSPCLQPLTRDGQIPTERLRCFPTESFIFSKKPAERPILNRIAEEPKWWM